MKNKQKTPLEKLISDKQRIRLKCQEKELSLNGHFSYAQDNATGLFFSAFTSLLFPGSKAKESASEGASVVNTKPGTVLGLGLTDLLPIAKGALPIVWDVVRPLLFSYGITKAQGWVLHSLFKKK